MRFLKRNRAAILAALVTVCLTTTFLSGCSLSSEDSQKEGGECQVSQVMALTREDRRTSSDSAKSIDLSASGDELLITNPGDYRLKGEMNGSIHIMAEDQVVHLFLSGITVKSSTAPAINVESAGKVIITVEPGSENSLSDGSKYISDICDACIFSKCDLTLNGSGSLSVSGYYKDAVHTKDYLKIIGVKLSARAKDDVLHGNDGILADGAELTLEAEKNGMRTTKANKSYKGNIEITNSKVSVIAGEHALNAARSIYMASSKAMLKGVMSNTKAEHEIYIEEGCLVNG